MSIPRQLVIKQDKARSTPVGALLRGHTNTHTHKQRERERERDNARERERERECVCVCVCRGQGGCHDSTASVPIGTSRCTHGVELEKIVCPQTWGSAVLSVRVGQMPLCSHALLLPLTVAPTPAPATRHIGSFPGRRGLGGGSPPHLLRGDCTAGPRGFRITECHPSAGRGISRRFARWPRLGGWGVGTRPWWLALLACGGAYWPLALEPSAMASRHLHCRGHPPAWGGGGLQNAHSAHGVLP